MYGEMRYLRLMFSYFSTETEKCVKLCDNRVLRSETKYGYYAGTPSFSRRRLCTAKLWLNIFTQTHSAFTTTPEKRHNYERCIDVTVPHQIILAHIR